ncbi:glycoside hydrolase family 117 protein [Flavivirga rizhaonensis]|uniref:Glycosyl hydrolase n=1 Tax=Flavivirga rizhaonensis TaxID=2559571 RepID=A0A4S1E205_9FLAO|nr:family 43 glycosylhydrolase [Flavivirga rizhaonensis]TGV04373.1 glycosyl hydrolase [Flavivirga rizhaonensis]
MKSILQLFVILLFISSCQSNQENQPKNDFSTDSAEKYSEADYDFLAITNPEKLSEASKRALERGYHKNAEWFGTFEKYDLKGNIGYEKGVTRRDPTMVIRVDSIYYTYYTKATGKTYGFGTGDPEKKVFPWDKSEIWYATSKDGWEWIEQGVAITYGPKGTYDDRSVFTPEVLAHNGKYYLVYQCIKYPYLNRSKNTVGMSVADNPRGPWKRLEAPILEPSNDGIWLGDEDNRFKTKKQGSFDSQKVHDPTLLFYKNKFYLYYKGERMGERLTAGGREIRWGVAISEHPEGPYIKSEYNPITQSGHEICIWPYKGGMAIVHSDDGPEQRTLQYAPDGINFKIKAYIKEAPSAMGLVTTLDNEKSPTEALKWGLCLSTKFYEGRPWQEGDDYIQRFSYITKHNTAGEFVEK